MATARKRPRIAGSHYPAEANLQKNQKDPTHSAKRRGRPKDPALAAKRRDDILDMTAKVFAKRGYAGTDLQIVADALGVGKGTIYRYFPSKQRLFLAAVDRGMLRIRETVDEAIENVVDPLDRISTALATYLGFFDEHAEFAELLVLERAVFKDRKKPTYFVHREANIGRWRELYANLIADGRMRAMPVERAANVISNLAYGTMFTNFFAGRQESLARQAGEIMDILFYGILTDAERRNRPPK